MFDDDDVDVDADNTFDDIDDDTDDVTCGGKVHGSKNLVMARNLQDRLCCLICTFSSIDSNFKLSHMY